MRRPKKTPREKPKRGAPPSGERSAARPGARGRTPRKDHVPRGTADHGAYRRDRRTPQATPGGHRCRGDRVGEDDATAQGVPPGRPRRAWGHRPYAAAAPCRADRGVAHRQRTRRGPWRGGRLRGAFHRPDLGADGGQGGHRRVAAQRDPARPDAQTLCLRDRRRGPRTQPQRRLHPRLPEASPSRGGAI